MSELTPYQLTKFNQFQSLPAYKWFSIQPDRPDRDEFIEAVKLYIDAFGTAEFDRDYKKFRFTWRPSTIEWMERHCDAK